MIIILAVQRRKLRHSEEISQEQTVLSGVRPQNQAICTRPHLLKDSATLCLRK